jgi:hypothetical protein
LIGLSLGEGDCILKYCKIVLDVNKFKLLYIMYIKRCQGALEVAKSYVGHQFAL